MNAPRIDRTALRSRNAGTVSLDLAEQETVLTGWVHRRRDLGGMVFVDLRDRSGIVQVSVGPDWSAPEALEAAKSLGMEDVVRIVGVVRPRPEEAKNTDMATGLVEVQATGLEILNKAATPAIPVYIPPEEELPSEKLRLRHRVLDLRRFEMQERLALRHRIVLTVRTFLDQLGFLEIETPILTKPTPEGARDFLVPSRVHPGEFFSLPQSPQIYKQILMAAGFDRYFQIARCFRDEDLRADRQPEFTQIDLEASFVEVSDILDWVESLMTAVATAVDQAPDGPFPRMSHAEAMERFGIDRPDLRYELEIQDMTDILGSLDSTILTSAVASGGRIRGFLLEGGASLSRKQIESIEGAAKKAGAPGLLWAKVTEDGASGPLGRFFVEDTPSALGASPGDLILVAAGADRSTSPALAATRTAAIETLGMPKVQDHAWLWVTDFPLFEPFEGGMGANHHPFVQPHPDDLELLETDPLSVRGLAYDLVYNGMELGSGSIRPHDADLQIRILEKLGMDLPEIESRFGFLLEALRSGAPPHGGMALGVDRIALLMGGGESLRDVIAFPKTTAARSLFEGAPVSVTDEDLVELGIGVTAPARKGVEDRAVSEDSGVED